MAKKTPSRITLLPSLLLLFFIITEVKGAKKSFGIHDSDSNCGSAKLFVFGDSYVDTGNFVHSESYKPPNGITFPGSPAGRFSDGRVLTDYVASFLKIESPIPNTWRNSSNLEYGINFAYGGTGIFDTTIDGPNMTVQIDSFEKLIQQNVYSKQDLASSVALVNAGGNDYTTFILKHGNIFRVKEFTESLVNQMEENLKRIQKLGINKIAVGLLQPVGCLPIITVVTLHEKCIEILNLVSENHNKLLLDAVQELNQFMGKPVFVTLDLYSAFLTTIANFKKTREENSTWMNPLQSCCEGENFNDPCGKVDDKGEKKYKLCETPQLSFFWDNVHPSQNGWNAITPIFQSSFLQLI